MSEAQGFDPRKSAEEQRGLPLRRAGRDWHERPESYLRGAWEQRNVLNVPGPFYGAETDTCWDGPPFAPDSLLCDFDGLGFVWRQPRTAAETHALMEGASSDPFSGFSWDGDENWTPQSVLGWWATLTERVPIVEALVAKLSGPEFDPLWARIASDYQRYLESDLEEDLARYIHFLENGAYPWPKQRLPRL